MNGRRRAYFSSNKTDLREPRKMEETEINLETNLSSNSVKQIIMKMLKNII